MGSGLGLGLELGLGFGLGLGLGLALTLTLTSPMLIHAELEAALARLRHCHDLLRDTRTAQPTDAVLAHVARVPVGVLRGGVRAGGRVREDDRDLG